MGSAGSYPMVRRQGATGPAATRVTRREFALAAVAGLDAVLAAVSGGATVPDPAEPNLDERTRLAHLLRRAGFGASRAEFAEYADLGLQGAVDRLLDGDQVPDDVDDRVSAAHPDFDLTKLADLQQWWLLRFVLARQPLREKMVLFWHGFLTSGVAKVGKPPLMLRQNQFFREHAFDDYRTILQGISRDPAMMVYLDTARSRKAHPNENYARELMELFTTGIGNYTENDVLESARAFTGWYVDKEGNAAFNPRGHDGGVKTVLGHTGPFTGEDIVNILVEHPATGWRLARKLFTFFAYDPPDGTVLQPLVEAYYFQGFSVRAMLRALFASDAFYSPAAYRARIKSPAEFVVGALRQFEVTTSGKGLPFILEGMGQRLFDPPNVAGWPGGAAWLNSGTWLNRLNFINRLVTNRRNPDIAPLDLAGLLQSQGLDMPDKVARYFVDLLLDGHISATAWEVLLEYANAGRNPRVAGPLWTDQRWVDERARGLLYLVMAMPEYHLN